MPSILPPYAITLDDGRRIDLRAFVAQIAEEEVQAALASAGLPSHPLPPWVDADPIKKEIVVHFDNSADDWTIGFDVFPSRQIVELNRLVRIFENIELHASFIYEHLRDQNVQDEAMRRVIPDTTFSRVASNRRSAMRKSVTMRDSAGQMAQLLRGENLDVDPDEELTGGSRV